MNKSSQVLSDYQRAVLHHLGLSCWKAQSNEPKAGENHSIVHPQEPALAADKATNQQAALTKLQQLKSQTLNQSYAGKVVCSFNPDQEYLLLLNDILQALRLEAHPRVTISDEVFNQASDFVFGWDNTSQDLKLVKNQLFTPGLTELSQAAFKKRLWQILQNWSLS